MPTIAVAESPLRPSARPRKRPKLRRWIVRGVLSAIALAAIAAVVLAWLPDPIVVDVAVARRMSLSTEVTEDGKTRVRDRFVVAAPMTGELSRVELDPGQSVAQDQTLATIAPPTPQLLDARSRDEAAARLSIAIAHERTARATIGKAIAARDVAVREAARTRTLVQRGAIPKIEEERATLAADVAVRDLATAEAQRAAAVAEIDAARAILGTPKPGRTTAIVTAPISGRVLRVLRESAGPVTAGTPLVELGDLANLELVIDVLSSDAATITAGMPVEIERWGGDGILRGTVARVEPAGFTRVSALGVEEQRVRVIAAITTPPPTLGDGFGVAARIITWHADDVLAIPASAVFRHRGEWAVYIVDGDRARRQTITIRHRGRLDVEVADMKEGTRVILHPGDSVHDGAKVQTR